MFKKMLSLILSVSLVLSVAVPGVAGNVSSNSSGTSTPDPQKVIVTFLANNNGKFDTSQTHSYYSDRYILEVTLDNLGIGSYGDLPPKKHLIPDTGYVFDGWYDAASGGKKISDKQTLVSTADHNIYAHWTPKTYAFTLNAGEGHFGNNENEKTLTETKNYGDKFDSLTKPSRDGYTFAGWKKSPDTPIISGTISDDTAEDNVDDPDAVNNLVADWTPITYTISFDYNYPQGDKDTIVITPSPVPAVPTPIKVPFGSAYGVSDPAAGVAPVGYVFGGWALEKVPTTADRITSTTNLSTASNHTLYAQWKKNEDVFIVALNYGSVLTTPKDAVKYVLYNKPTGTVTPSTPPIATPAPAPTPAPPSGGGSGGSNTPTGPDTTPPTTPTTRSASATPAPTPTPSPEPGKAYYGQAKLPAPEIDGYVFLGWAKNATKDSEGNMVVPSAEPTVNSWDSVIKDHTLYAKWQPAKHTLTFNLNYTPAPSPNPYPPKEAEHNAKVINLLPTTNPTRSGYRFAGWTAGGNPVDKYTLLDQDMTVYASWVPANSVKLNVNGGKLPANASDTILVSSTGENNKWPILPQPTRDGYDFLGWYTETTGGNKIIAGSEVVGEPPLQLYAQWAAKQYTVSFDYNGTTGSSEPKKFTYGEKYMNLPTNATWPGHTFMGWYTAASGGERVVAGETTVQTAADHTLYARWGFKISFEPGAGFGKMEDDLAPLGEDYALPECQFEAPDGKSFYRWAVGTARGEQLSAGTRVPISRNTALYAIWKESPIEIEVSSTSGGSLVSSEGNSGIITMERGSSITFTARPSRGYQVAELIIDGDHCPKLTRFTFTDLQENHSIHAVFEVIPNPGYSSCDHNYDCPLRRFQDLNPNAWYHDAVHYCLDEVFMNGMSSERYSPNTRATRAMLVTVLWQAAGCPYTPTSGAPGKPFNDVSPQSWYYKQICWAKAEGIVAGYSSGNFGPDNPITREQLVTILWQYAGKPGHSENRLPYYDSWAVSNYAWDAMLWATENGIISGTGNNTLNPKGYATRAQIAQFTMAFMRYTGRL